MTAKLRSAAQQALARPRFRELLKLVPAAERDNAKALLGWLTTAADFDRKGADSAEFHDAYEALSDLAAAEDLQNRVAAAYWDPKLRAQYGTEAVERAWHDPATARELLLKESAAGRLSPAADAALRTIYEAEAFASEQGSALPQPAARPIPTGQDAQAAEYAELIGKSAGGKLTKAEDERLTQLAQARVAHQDRQEAAAEAASAQKPSPSEYEALIAKSVSGGLTAAENGRLDHLAGERSIAAGLATAEDIEADAAMEE